MLVIFLLRIILIFIAIGLFIFLGFDFDDGRYKSNRKQLFAFIPVVIVALSLCIAWVPANNVGIKWSAVSGTSKKTLSEGIKFISPLDKIYLIDTTVQERTMKDVTVQTKDAQFVKSQVNIKFQVNKKDAFKVYKRYGSLDALKQNIIANYSQKSIETVATQYNITDILGEKKNELYKLSTDELSKMLKDEGVQLVSMTIKDMNAGKDIEKAISNEAVAKKEVETAEQEKLKAKKEAETKVIKAKAEAEANKLKEKTLTKEILMQKMLEKWNGELPRVTDGSNGLFDLNSLIK